MSALCRRFHGSPVTRLIVSAPLDMVAEVDRLIQKTGHPARRCRSEFVRLAIAEKLAREQVDVQMSADMT